MASNEGDYVVEASSNGKLSRAYEVLFGPPYPGLEARVNAFITTFEAVEKTRHEENQAQLSELNRKLGIRSFWVAVGGLAIAFASLMVGIAAIAATVYLAKHADAEPWKLFSQPFEPALQSWHSGPEDSVMTFDQEATQR